MSRLRKATGGCAVERDFLFDILVA